MWQNAKARNVNLTDGGSFRRRDLNYKGTKKTLKLKLLSPTLTFLCFKLDRCTNRSSAGRFQSKVNVVWHFRRCTFTKKMCSMFSPESPAPMKTKCFKLTTFCLSHHSVCFRYFSSLGDVILTVCHLMLLWGWSREARTQVCKPDWKWCEYKSNTLSLNISARGTLDRWTAVVAV